MYVNTILQKYCKVIYANKEVCLCVLYKQAATEPVCGSTNCSHCGYYDRPPDRSLRQYRNRLLLFFIII